MRNRVNSTVRRRGALVLFGLMHAVVGCELLSGPAALDADGQALLDAKMPAAELAAKAAADFDALVALGGSDPVGDIIEALGDQPGVAGVELSIDGSTIIIEMDNGEFVSLFTDEKDRDEWDVAESRRIVADPSVVLEGPLTFDMGSRQGLANASHTAADDFIICDETSFPQSNTACVVLNFQSEFNQDSSAITEPLKRAGFTIKTLRLQSIADLKTFKDSLSDCGVLYISTHGGVGSTRTGVNANLLSTEIPMAQGAALGAQVNQLLGVFTSSEINSQIAVTGSSGQPRWGLTPEFFKSATYKNTLVFIDACQSNKAVGSGGDQLRDAFLDNGAGAFIGWDESVSTALSNPAAVGVFEGLAPIDLGVQSILISVFPGNPGPGDSYVPTVQVQPPAAGIEVRLNIQGSDLFRRSEAKTTDSFGEATFASVPGAATNVTDTITAVTGGPQNGATVVNSTVKNDPTLNDEWKLRWRPGTISVASLSYIIRSGADPGFNIACQNAEQTSTEKVVKF
ncbi:MAG: hypothetical protein V3T70_02710 [Phycisphaerae bacterium]